ncbi:MAG TPA: hypothetical protein VLA56_22265 [Pseudomonadales bacterium]|nr:hypothetical protein [Pseudomonadales bacterium]
MSRTLPVSAFALLLCVLLALGAWLTAPASCTWGLTAYSLLGTVVVCVQMWMPLGLRAGATPNRRFGLAALLATCGVVTWMVAAELAGVRYLCGAP